MLKLQLKNQQGLEFTLDRAQLSLGRDESNDIVVEGSGVSGYHANIFFENGKVEVVDLGSTNGTRIDGKPVRGRTPLKPWQELDVGGVKFELVDTEARRPTMVQKAVGKTQVRPAAATQVRPAVSSGGKAIATLSLKSSAHNAPPRIELRRDISIGRDAGNDVRLDSDTISSQHARLLVSDTQVILMDLGSTNGTRVNGRKIIRQVLSNGDTVSFDEIAYRYASALEDRGHTQINPRLHQPQAPAAPTVASVPVRPEPPQAPKAEPAAVQSRPAAAHVSAPATPEPARAPEPAPAPQPAPPPQAPPPGGYVGPQKIEVSIAKPKGSILGGALVMFFVSLLLFWLPFVGPLIAGIVGGKKAGGIGAAFVAVLLPALVAGGIIAMAAGSIAGVPLIGAIAGVGVFVLSLVHIGPLMLGAIIGGALV